MTSKPHVIELKDDLLGNSEPDHTAVIIGRDLTCYLIALMLKQHGHKVTIVSRPQTPIMTDLQEYLSLKYVHEAASRLRSIRHLRTKGLQAIFDDTLPSFDWHQLTRSCKQEFAETKASLEKTVAEKGIAIYEGTIVMVEKQIVRIVSEDEMTQLALVRTKYVIMGSDVCRSTIRDYSDEKGQKNTLKRLADIIDLDRIPRSLAVIGGGMLGLSVASCIKELGCKRVIVIDRRSHLLVDGGDIDMEIVAYIESMLVKQQIDIITNCLVNHVTETAIHSATEPIETECRFLAVGAQRKAISVLSTPSKAIIQLIERLSFGRKIRVEAGVDDDTLTPIVPIDYQRVKSTCSMEQAISIAYRTICKCLNDPKPNFFTPSFVYMIPPLLLIGRTRIPSDDMFIRRVALPMTIKYAIDSPPRGFGKLWISRTRQLLCGVQLLSEHAQMFGKAFGILIRNQISVYDVCKRIELPGSIGEAVQLIIKQAMYNIVDEYRIPRSIDPIERIPSMEIDILIECRDERRRSE